MHSSTLIHPLPTDHTSKIFPSLVLTLSPRQSCDLECLLNGAFSPLQGFLEEHDYLSVCHHMRLSNGQLWPIPITLDVPESFAKAVDLEGKILLTNAENTPLALLTVRSKWQPNKDIEARLVYGTTDMKHPGVHALLNETHPWYLGGPLTPLALPVHYDFIAYRHTPAQLKELFKLYGYSKIIAFQTRNPIHKAHFELTQRAAQKVNANLLIHPVVGMTKPGDIDAATRVLCYEKILEKYVEKGAMLSLLPLAMRMAGPREALWHALIRKNYGVTHFIVGRDHAGPGLNSQGVSFYEPYAAQELFKKHEDEIGIEMVPFQALVYVQEKEKLVTLDEVSADDTVLDISGTKLREHLEKGQAIPDWFSFPEVIQILQKRYPKRCEQGYTLFFTGLSGSGKSTLAKAVMARFLEKQRAVTLLDGDIIRKHLSNELGFSKADRDIHLQRMGFVASEMMKHRGIVICAAIAPYAMTRKKIRASLNEKGGFIEIYVATPIEVCKKRDIKGLYKKAELGLIKEFTGISDPYEVPEAAEVVIDTSKMTVEEGVEQILTSIDRLGFQGP